MRQRVARNHKRGQVFKTGDIVFVDDWVTDKDALVQSDGRGPFLVRCDRNDMDISHLAHLDGRILAYGLNRGWNPDAFRRDDFLTAVRKALTVSGERE